MFVRCGKYSDVCGVRLRGVKKEEEKLRLKRKQGIKQDRRIKEKNGKKKESNKKKRNKKKSLEHMLNESKLPKTISCVPNSDT